MAETPAAGFPRLILASESPRRSELLSLLRVPFDVEPSGVEEDIAGIWDPAAAALVIAERKGRAVAEAHAQEDVVVLAADTAVVLGRERFGKPADEQEARAMLAKLQGRSHRVLTGVYVERPRLGRRASGVEETRVLMRSLSPELIDKYVRTGEPMDKAGAYGVQGLGAALVARMEGDWTNVVGLPVGLTVELLREVEVDIWAAW